MIIIVLLKFRRLTLKYTLLWMFTGLCLLVLVMFPGIILRIAAIGGFQSSMNALYIILIAFLMMLTIMLTSIVSKQTERIRYLAQQNALLEERLRTVEHKLEEIPDDKESNSDQTKGTQYV